MRYQNQKYPQYFFRARAQGTYRKGCWIGRIAFLRELRNTVFSLFHFSLGSDFAEIAQQCRMAHEGFRESLTSQASKMTVFRFQENGLFLQLAYKYPACRLRQSGGCAHKCIACRYLEQLRSERMSGQMPCLQGSDPDAKSRGCIYRCPACR